MTNRERILVLALGNDLFADDAVGLVASRALKTHFPSGVDFVEAAGHGLDLLDDVEGRDCVLLLDSIVTGVREPGSLVELTEKDFGPSGPGSPHSSGLPEALLLARKLSLSLPRHLRVLAMEIRHTTILGTGLSAQIQQSMPAFISRAKEIISAWIERK